VWFCGVMINRIMQSRAAALALAAPLLLTAPALADQGKVSKRAGASISVQTGNGGLHINVGDRGYRSYGYSTRRDRGYRGQGYGLNEYGQTRNQVKRLKRQAIRACRGAIRNEAYNIGFRDVDFEDGRRAYQIGPRGFEVRFNEVEFEGRRRDIERSVSCIVRRGDYVKRIDGIPHRGQRGQARRTGYYN